MFADGKSNSDGNVVLKGASTEAHSLWMGMDNLKIIDDTEGHNRGYQLGNSNRHVKTPDLRTNNADVLLDSQLKNISKNIGTIQMKYIIWERFH